LTLSGLRGSLQTDGALATIWIAHREFAKRFKNEAEHERPLNVRVMLNGGGGVGLSHAISIAQLRLTASFLFDFF
jgi:hypothetical protein